MANTNFQVHNGLTVGPLSIDAATGSISTTGTIGGAGGYLNGAIGANTANTGAFTTITASSTLNVTGTAAFAGTITAATMNATTIGNSATVFTASSSTVSNSLSVNSANNATAIVNGGTNGTGNIGSSTTTFNTVFAKATTAQYADLAECYAGDADYEAGTVVEFGGDNEVTISSNDASTFIAGVVSTNPAYLMNSAIEANFPIAVALTGRVPTKVIGPVKKGQMMVSAGNGRARAETNPVMGSVIGKAVENFSVGEGVIEVVVGRL